MSSGELHTKHLRAEIEDADGTRVYISRVWPRGIAKGERFSEWKKELAPSRGLQPLAALGRKKARRTEGAIGR